MMLTALCLVLGFAALYYRAQRPSPALWEDFQYFREATGWTKGKSIGRELIDSRRYTEALESRNKRLGEALAKAIDREVELENRLSESLSRPPETDLSYERLKALFEEYCPVADDTTGFTIQPTSQEFRWLGQTPWTFTDAPSIQLSSEVVDHRLTATRKDTPA